MLKFDLNALALGLIVNRLDAIEANLEAIKTKLDVILRGGVSDEQYRILTTDISVRKKAEKLGRSIGWISKQMKHLGINNVHKS
jgi:CobQ-like glutamine amidotransferase family enzyme